jgi:NAD(P)-dependent dehydrogenase (short-subunit alcohol dehydrogenase family)
MKVFQRLLAHGYDVSFVLGDFSSLQEVEALIRELQESYPRIDVLINNAGIFNSSFALSSEGFEMQFAVNHLAPFLLTTSLLELGILVQGARVINVSSDAHRRVSAFNLDKLNDPDHFHFFKTYCKTKLCNVLFAYELSRRYPMDRCSFYALHPGAVSTGIGMKSNRLLGLLWRMMKPFLKTVKKGAETSIYLASTDKIPESVGYYTDCQKTSPSVLAQEPQLSAQLWEYSKHCLQAHMSYPLK